MMKMDSVLLSALLVLANVLGVGMVIPQLLRVRRFGGRAAGLSAAWVGVGLAMNCWWVAYAVHGRLLGLIPVSVGAGVLYLMIAILLLRGDWRAAARPLGAGACMLGSFPLPFLFGGGWTSAGVAVGFAYALQFVPAAVTAIRSEDVAGIAATTWVMAFVEAVIWLGYGLSVEDAPLMVGGAGAGLAALAILVRLLAWPDPGGLGGAFAVSTAAEQA